MNFTDPTVIMFSLFLLLTLFIGFLGYRGTDNLDDYSLDSFVTALSAGASDMSGWLLMGLPGAIYLSGAKPGSASAWSWALTSTGASSPRGCGLYTERAGNALTLPDYFANRFEDKAKLLRILTTVVILVFFTIYCASGVAAGARLFENMFGLPYQTALWVGAACTIACANSYCICSTLKTRARPV